MPTFIKTIAFGVAFACLAPLAWAADAASGVLDGKVFVGTMHVDTYDKPFEDALHFDQGLFLSEECQRACDFGQTPYFTRREGDSIAFVVSTSCSDAPHSVQWEGRVTGNKIEGTVIWKSKRFYGTFTRNGTFSGTLQDTPEEQAMIISK